MSTKTADLTPEKEAELARCYGEHWPRIKACLLGINQATEKLTAIASGLTNAQHTHGTRTLRDRFAERAMPLVIAALDHPNNNPDGEGFDWGSGGSSTTDQRFAAELAYTMADAMLAERGRS